MGRRIEDPMAPHRVLETLMRLAAESASRRRRKGDRVPASQIAKVQATKREKYRARVKEAWERRKAARPKGRYNTAPPFGERLADRIVGAMRPGEWYGRFDLVRAIGEGRPATAKINQELLPWGWIERRRNPAYKGPMHPRDCARGLYEPLWLYRLTRRGEWHREALALIGAAAE